MFKKATVNKKTILFTALGAAALLFLLYYRPAFSPKKTEVPLPQVELADKKLENKLENYIEYTQESFESNRDKKRVLYFYANWCTTCIPANADFVKNASLIPENVVVYKVNYKDTETDETEKQLAEKYKIPYQHTFVQVDENGEVVTRWNGGKVNDLINKLK